jgi:hypothetical protein
VVGKLNYLEKEICTDISYTTHQCVRFSEDPHQSHVDAVIWLCKYLLTTKDKGIIYDPKRDKSIELYADAALCGNWNKDTAAQDVIMTKSRTDYLLKFSSFTIPYI